MIVATSVTVLVLFLDSLAAFTFAKYELPGSKLLFTLLLVMFVLPAQLSLIPQFRIMIELGWVGTLPALVVPAAANAFGIFWLRQYASSAIPDELLEAIRLDGAGFLRQYWHIALPLIRPGLAFLAICAFTLSWNDYAWPLIAMVDPSNATLQVAPSQLNAAGFQQDQAMVMTGALMAVVPLVVVFPRLSRGFVRDAAKGAVNL